MLNDTIVAISTALSESAISIVRMSGPEAIEIADKLYSKDISKAKTYSIHFGHIIDPSDESFVDEAIISIFRDRKSVV